MDNIERRVLNLIQSDFPLTSRPYQKLARHLGMKERDLILRMRILKEKGSIRRLGAVLNSEALGYPGVLVAARVPKRDLNSVARIVGDCPGVTHAYEREGGKYNFWFTLQASDWVELNRVLRELEQKITAALVLLPSRRKFKIDLRLAF